MESNGDKASHEDVMIDDSKEDQYVSDLDSVDDDFNQENAAWDLPECDRDMEGGGNRRLDSQRRGSMLRRRLDTDESFLSADGTERGDRLQRLLTMKQIRSEVMSKSVSDLSEMMIDIQAESSLEAMGDEEFLDKLRREVEGGIKADALSARLMEIESLLQSYNVSRKPMAHYPLEVRVSNLHFVVPVYDKADKIKTVFNSSPLYYVYKFIRRLVSCESLRRPKPTMKKVLENVNLVLEPGKSYLVLGQPGSGKTSLLKAISGLLKPTGKERVEGEVYYNGRTLKTKDEFVIENAFAYIDQLDKHAPRLSVEETFKFAYDCKSNGSIEADDFLNMPNDAEDAKKAIEDNLNLQLILCALGLSEVKNTFVGDGAVRGVSGGQRRRVTVGEMLTSRSSVLCGDEISTGLDAASTYDMIEVLIFFGKFHMLTRIFSLLQPGPEVVSLFDEVIVLAEGRIIYAGPVGAVEDYFANIGFVCPHFTDVADFLQMVSTEDGRSLYDPAVSNHVNRRDPPSATELADIFNESDWGKRILDKLEEPYSYLWKRSDSVSRHDGSQVSRVAMSNYVKRRYANSFFRSTYLIVGRFIILWLRDRRVIIAGAVKNVLMGVSVGGAFLSTGDPVSIQGALFQACLFIMLGAMQSASALVTDRVIFYKHADANFYSAWPFVAGRALSQLPQTAADTFVFSTILYFMIGLAGRDSASNYLIYLFLLLVFAFLMIQQLAVFASFANAGSLNGYSACIILLLTLFGGFIVVPSSIPNYYAWLYWWNPCAWVYRALVVNEFRSGRWDADAELTQAGMVGYDQQPFSEAWVGYAFAYMLPYSAICLTLAGLGLSRVRNLGATASVASKSLGLVTDSHGKPVEELEIKFKPVTLSFRDLCYDVTASKGGSTLRLLHNVTGIFHAGRMCALMGSSGAGKTTLLDVITLRKHTGKVSGTIFLNGWPQDRLSFRRCSGFVEQFDVQSPELTVYETIEFSAKLRLDSGALQSDSQVEAFVCQIMASVELTGLRNALIGTEEDYGLSFEQKKRLSIAVELAASPSILFLDEPTSGLDARSAMVVVKTLRRIADTGRTVCATIHQPSSAVFSMFDDLLFLRKGGEVVYHGELGSNSSSIVSYFESKGCTPIELGDNPANWMLRVLETSAKNLVAAYLESKECASIAKKVDDIQNCLDPEMRIQYQNEFACTKLKRFREISRRLRIIYWRSPTYNTTRLLVSLAIAVVLGSAFLGRRDPSVFLESGMRARVSVVFLSFIITGIMAMISVLPVMTKIRDMYYRHRDASMYDSVSIGIALGSAEKWFIVLSTAIFTTMFISMGGFVLSDEPLFVRARRSIGFWGFFTFNFAIYSYFGQLFVCLVKPMATAIILSSVFIGLNNFFAGLVIRPQFMLGTFYAVPYYICPGHYVYDGLLHSLYGGSTELVIADSGSDFDLYLIATYNCTTGNCTGTVDEYVNIFFGGDLGQGRPWVPGVVLGGILTLSRLLTWVALKYIRCS